MSAARVLLALSSETPTELVTPIEAALAAQDLEVHRVDLGRITAGTGVSVIDRVAKVLLGEVVLGEHLAVSTPSAIVLGIAAAAMTAATVALGRDEGAYEEELEAAARTGG